MCLDFDKKIADIIMDNTNLKLFLKIPNENNLCSDITINEVVDIKENNINNFDERCGYSEQEWNYHNNQD